MCMKHWDLLHVSRIDHGACRRRRSADAADYCRANAADRVPFKQFEVESGGRFGVQHNLHRLLQRGVLVTVNSDDPAYFGGYVNDNFALQQTFGLSTTEIAQLCKNSFKPRFWTSNPTKMVRTH